MLWNGQYAEIGGATGDVDLAIDSQGHVTGGVTMESFALAPDKIGKNMSDVTVTGSAEFDTEICPNYPISGSVTITKDGDSQTITFTNNCDGTFEGGSQGQTGDVSFRLTWSGPQDLDLYVDRADGETIYYGNTDVVYRWPARRRLERRLQWPESEPDRKHLLAGRQRAARHLRVLRRRWNACSATTTPAFTLRVFEGSTVVRTINGTMPEGGETEHYTHVY